MTVQGLKDILPGKMFYANITNLAARQGNLPKFMIFASAFIAPSCLIQNRNDEPHITGNGGEAST